MFSQGLVALFGVIAAIFVLEPNAISGRFAHNRGSLGEARSKEFRRNGNLDWYSDNERKSYDNIALNAAKNFSKSCDAMPIVRISVINAAQDRENDRMFVVSDPSSSPSAFNNNRFTREAKFVPQSYQNRPFLWHVCMRCLPSYQVGVSCHSQDVGRRI